MFQCQHATSGEIKACN